MEYYRVPEDDCKIVKKLYCCFKTSVVTNGFVTDFVHMGKDVLQGDIFEPLMINLIINTFIQSVKHEQYEHFDYKFMRYLTSRHWYQFANGAAVISSHESENEMFSRWCS